MLPVEPSAGRLVHQLSGSHRSPLRPDHPAHAAARQVPRLHENEK